jgi:hypothetical protein
VEVLVVVEVEEIMVVEEDEEMEEDQKCSEQLVLNVVMVAKSLLDQHENVQYIVVIVSEIWMEDEEKIGMTEEEEEMTEEEDEEMILLKRRCMQQYVLNVETIVNFHSNLLLKDLFFVVIVSSLTIRQNEREVKISKWN